MVVPKYCWQIQYNRASTCSNMTIEYYSGIQAKRNQKINIIDAPTPLTPLDSRR